MNNTNNTLSNTERLDIIDNMSNGDLPCKFCNNCKNPDAPACYCCDPGTWRHQFEFMTKEFENGAEVYVISSNDVAEKCIVLDYFANENSSNIPEYRVRSCETGDEFNVITRFVHADDSYAGKIKFWTREDIVTIYENSIKSVADLVQFALMHDLLQEKEAMIAYKHKAKELLNIIV